MASTETHLKVLNYTKNSMRITISSVENSDWDGDSRPDHNFSGVTINAFSSRIEREETNDSASSSNFNMNITFSNGDQITLRIDQQDGKHNYQQLFSCSGANDDDYVVFQNNDNSNSADDDHGQENLNRFIITSKNWMRDISDNKYIHQITIPGTHDSGTYTTEAKLVPYTQCQTLDIEDQLKLGIRFLDIRCAEEDNKFQIHHGVVHLGLEFGADIRDKCIDFLQDNPTEFIIMSIKQEQDPEDSTESFENVLKDYISGHESYFYTGRTFPAIRDVRGKIVLFSRYSNNTIGINATPWSDNQIFEISGKQIKVQDKYEVDDTSDKWDDIHDTLQDADDNNSGYLYLNFCSGTLGGATSLYTPSDVARYVNAQLFPYVARKKAKRYGILPMDYPSSFYNALVRAVIGANFTDQ